MAETVEVAVRPRGTSWMSVIGGWIASVGMAALLAPFAAGVVAARGGAPDDLSLAVPAVLAVMVAYLVGGYVAGRMSGYATSWHGLLTAFFGLLVILAVVLVGVASERGYLGDVRVVAPDGTSLWSFGPVVGEALTFGAILGFLAAIFAGWLGGLLAPTRRYVAATRVDPVEPLPPAEPVRTVEETTVVQRSRPRRPSFKLLPSPGRKGGERVVERKVEQTER